jgi:hypothetical protein
MVSLITTSTMKHMKRALIGILAAAAGGLGLLVQATPPHAGVVAEPTSYCWICHHHQKGG